MKTEWDLSYLHVNFDEERNNANKSTNNFVSNWKHRDDYLESPEILKQALIEYEDWFNNYKESNEAAYYWLKQQKNSEDTTVTAKANSINNFTEKLYDKMRFFELNIAKIPPEKQQSFLNYGGLENYKHYLEKTFEDSKYLLSEKEEKIVDLKERSSHQSWADLTERLLLSEEREVDLGQGNLEKKTYPDLLTLMKSKDKNIRYQAKEKFEDILEKHSIVAEVEINAILRNKLVDDELRGFSRFDKERHVSDDIDSEVVDTLIDAVTERFDITKKYYGLKSKLLGLEKLDYSERAIDYGEINSSYDYETSVNLVKNSLIKLDSEFGKIFSKFVDTGKIDVFPEKGKNGGAFCVNFTPNKPTYILLNHTNTLNDVSTIAHETGHGINSELMKKQTPLNFGTPKSTAEVASTFMEDFALDEVLKNSNDEERLAILMQKLEGDLSSVQRQVAFYNFEKDLHQAFKEESYLDKSRIGEMFKKNLSQYMGDSVDCSSADNWWMYVGHFRSPFYVYSYASGVLISKSMQEKVKENPEFIGNVKQFLSAGTSKSPKDLFLDMGIDITKKEFWNKGLDGLEKKLNEAEELARKLGKI